MSLKKKVTTRKNGKSTAAAPRPRRTRRLVSTTATVEIGMLNRNEAPHSNLPDLLWETKLSPAAICCCDVAIIAAGAATKTPRQRETAKATQIAAIKETTSLAVVVVERPMIMIRERRGWWDWRGRTRPGCQAAQTWRTTCGPSGNIDLSYITWLIHEKLFEFLETCPLILFTLLFLKERRIGEKEDMSLDRIAASSLERFLLEKFSMLSLFHLFLSNLRNVAIIIIVIMDSFGFLSFNHLLFLKERRYYLLYPYIRQSVKTSKWINIRICIHLSRTFSRIYFHVSTFVNAFPQICLS